MSKKQIHLFREQVVMRQRNQAFGELLPSHVPSMLCAVMFLLWSICVVILLL